MKFPSGLYKAGLARWKAAGAADQKPTESTKPSIDLRAGFLHHPGPERLLALQQLAKLLRCIAHRVGFSAAQALLAAKAGATYISPFVGRLDDVGTNGMELIREIVEIYDNYDFATQVLVASCRHPIHIVESARMGAHVATCPPSVIDQLFNHPLTNIGLEKFLKDWAASQAGKA